MKLVSFRGWVEGKVNDCVEKCCQYIKVSADRSLINYKGKNEHSQYKDRADTVQL
jgi:hypothetical protein